MTTRRVCLYSPADLNLVSGSAIWVQSGAETFHVGADVEIVLPLRAPERRRIITDQIRQLTRVTLVDPRRQRRFVPPTGLYSTEALDLIETLNAEQPFDAIVMRSFPYCLAAIERPSLRGRLWSTYILEPERDITDPGHVAELTAIAEASRYVVVQSEEMRCSRRSSRLHVGARSSFRPRSRRSMRTRPFRRPSPACSTPANSIRSIRFRG